VCIRGRGREEEETSVLFGFGVPVSSPSTRLQDEKSKSFIEKFIFLRPLLFAKIYSPVVESHR
jgi:hypothetical protein